MATIQVKDANGTTQYLEVEGAGTSANPFRPVNTGSYNDSASIDAFARLRVSNPQTLFDSKQIHDKQPLFWDDVEALGSGTNSVYNQATASTVLSVDASTIGKRIKQTFMRFNYQTGKSQLVLMTFTLDNLGGGTDIIRCAGQYDDDNGIFLKDDEGTIKWVIRSSTTGSAVDTEVAQASWNLDVMDGTGKSGITLDFTKSQILFFDYEWLGVGRVRCGFVIDGIPIYTHQFLNANVLAGVYMTTPNLPLRYEIENQGTGVASEIETICASIMSEGGNQDIGVLRYKSTEGTHLDANTADQLYALMGIRLKNGYLGTIVKEVSASLVAATTDNYEWVLIMNPTVAGTFTYNAETNSAIEVAIGATANTVSGGTALIGGFGSGDSSISQALSNAIRLGADISNTPDELVLCVRPLSANLDIDGGLTWRELT